MSVFCIVIRFGNAFFGSCPALNGLSGIGTELLPEDGNGREDGRQMAGNWKQGAKRCIGQRQDMNLAMRSCKAHTHAQHINLAMRNQ